MHLCSLWALLTDGLVVLRYIATALSDAGPNPVVAIRRRLSGFRSDDYLVSLSYRSQWSVLLDLFPMRLTYADEQRVCLEGDDRHQIRLDHLQVMTIDGEMEHGSG